MALFHWHRGPKCVVSQARTGSHTREMVKDRRGPLGANGKLIPQFVAWQKERDRQGFLAYCQHTDGQIAYLKEDAERRRRVLPNDQPLAEDERRRRVLPNHQPLEDLDNSVASVLTGENS